jgi:hypothetical protein
MNHFDLHKVFGMESTLVCGRIALSGRERDGVIVTDGNPNLCADRPSRHRVMSRRSHQQPVAHRQCDASPGDGAGAPPHHEERHHPRRAQEP